MDTEKKRTHRSVHISTDTYDRFKEYCDKNDLKMGRIATRLIEQYLEEKESEKK